MSVIDWIRAKTGGQDGQKVKVKKVKLTRSDIQENMLKIDEQIKSVQNNIRELTQELVSCDLTSEEGMKNFKETKEKIEHLNEVCSSFQIQQTRNLEHLEALGKSGKTEIVLKVVTVVGTIFLSVVGLGLNRESPSILKMVDFIVKPFRAPMKF